MTNNGCDGEGEAGDGGPCSALEATVNDFADKGAQAIDFILAVTHGRSIIVAVYANSVGELMTKYIAFLREINVGAHNRMKMDELRALFASLGHEDIETYIQSGNVVFESAQTGEVALRAEINEAIEDEFGYDISVIIRT